MSVAPPGGNGTMKRTGFCGQACAQAQRRESDASSQRGLNMFHAILLQVDSTAPARRRSQRKRGRRRDAASSSASHARAGIRSRVCAAPPVRWTASSSTMAHSLALTSGCSVQRRKDSSLASPCSACPSAQKCSGRKSASAMPESRWTRAPKCRLVAATSPEHPQHGAHAQPREQNRARQEQAMSRDAAAPAAAIRRAPRAGRSARAPTMASTNTE